MKYAETPCSHEKFPRALFPGKKEKKRSCPWCPKVITASNLSRHVRRVHKTELRGEAPRRTKLAGVSYAVSPARKEETLRQGPKLVIRPQEGTVRLEERDAYVEDVYDWDACGRANGGDACGGRANGGDAYGGRANGGDACGGYTHGGRASGGSSRGGGARGGSPRGGDEFPSDCMYANEPSAAKTVVEDMEETASTSNHDKVTYVEIDLAESELNQRLAELYSGRVTLKPTSTLKYEEVRLITSLFIEPGRQKAFQELLYELGYNLVRRETESNLKVTTMYQGGRPKVLVSNMDFGIQITPVCLTPSMSLSN